MRRLSANAPLVAAIVLCSLALAGCDVHVSASQAPDILLTRADSPAFGPDALPGGTLEIDLDGVASSSRAAQWCGRGGRR
jgi:hypothetical protein